MVSKKKQRRAMQYLFFVIAFLFLYGIIRANIGVLFSELDLWGVKLPFDFIIPGVILATLIVICYLFLPDLYKLHRSSDLD
jgi:hypothetical protein